MPEISDNRLVELGLKQPEQQQKPKNRDLGQADFLKLLVTQMSHQNPMEPQENGEFITQMAQFGTVDGIRNIEKLFAKMTGALQSNKALQASSLVGRSVRAQTPYAKFNGEKLVRGEIEVPQPVFNLQLQVYNDKGELVRNMKMGDAQTGTQEFTWDGKNEAGDIQAPGLYTIKAEGNVGNETYTLTTFMHANVDSVTLGPNGQSVTLNLAGVGSVPFDQVREIS